MSESVYCKAVILAVVLPLSACDPAPESTRILERIPSPDGQSEAVYANGMLGGATVGPSSDVYVTKPGQFPKLRDRAFTGEHLCNLRIRWLANNVLEIGYYARRRIPGENLSGPNRIIVMLHWLGRDAASGC